MKTWWKNVFEKTYLSVFEPLYSKDRTSSEIRFVIKALGLKKENSVLDIPCGAGRHSIELAKQGFGLVTGIDFSAVLLKAAKDNVRDITPKPLFIRDDMRHLKIKKRYDTCLVLGNSFGYFSDDDNEKVIGNLSRHLKTGGQLLVDLSNLIGMLRRAQTKSKIKIKGGFLLTEETAFDPKTLTVALRWTAVTGKKRKNFYGMLRLYTLPEMSRILKSHGLKVSKLFGSLYGHSYNIDSPRMVVIAEKV